MTHREVYEHRRLLFAAGKCPHCERTANFTQTGTRQVDAVKQRTLRCPHCGTAFRVNVRMDVSFSKITREGPPS